MSQPVRVVLAWLLCSVVAMGQGSIFEFSLRAASDALGEGRVTDAAVHIKRALERDPKSAKAWELRAAWAEAVGDQDELIYALHKEHGLRTSQLKSVGRKEAKEAKAKLVAVRERVLALDRRAEKLFSLRDKFLGRLEEIAKTYEKERRPHSAIRVYQQMLALDPELEAAAVAIERISALPDPSLAATAKPKDLLDGISEQWMREFDEEHVDWKKRGKLERDNYTTHTNAGYEVLVRSAEAMEQMNAFYRIFFQYGTEEDGGSVSRIDLNIFKNRDEYLSLGIGPPVEWSGGHFTGGAVETYISESGFEGMVGTLFHEAAHQFVSLATSAVGWLNEGLASFFEGCRILNNGTVIMNMPANHRLFPLVDRLKNGWMASYDDGLDPNNASATPTTAPTLEIIIENKYAWGPPWYAPTWGFVYFLYNYQDPADGRFIYRAAFREFINASGGRSGEGAIRNFEDVVLKNPQRPTKGLPRTEALKLVRSVGELNEVWKEWLIELADEQAGRSEVVKPYLDWARYAIDRKEFDVATEHFEKGLVQSPFDLDLLREFGEHLADRQNNKDRAVKLILEALRIVESEEKPDERMMRELEGLLTRWDPKRGTLSRIHDELSEETLKIVDGYSKDGLPLMAMEISWRLGTDLGVAGMFSRFEEAARTSGKSIALWQLAYNEENLDGWSSAGSDVWVPYGSELLARFGDYSEEGFAFNFLTCDKVTSGDFSMEVDLYAERGAVNFCGLVFGRKGDLNFHSVILHPGRPADPQSGRVERGGFLDLTSFYGGSSSKVWRHNPVNTSQRGWHTLRLDVAGTLADVWWDGDLVVTHDFGSVDVLRGSFGMITGPGSSRYRNIRYLARNPRDPGGRIERDLLMERLGKEAGTGALGGSWMRKVPPFPRVKRWVTGGRTSFAEAGASPQLLVFWSKQSNEIIPIDKWLNDVAERHKDVDLSVISVVNYVDEKEIDAYLKEHPFPGSVALDRSSTAPGFGATFDQYFIGSRFMLPRVLLLDVDGKVAYEGDPGFEAGMDWKPGQETYFDAPLAETIQRRRLPEAKRWMEAWQTKGGPAFVDGDFDRALPALLQARGLPRDAVPVVGDAQAWMRALENSVYNIEVTAERLTEENADAALNVLFDWGTKIDVEVSSKTKGGLKGIAQSSTAKAWKATLAAVAKSKKKIRGTEAWTELDALLTAIRGNEDRFTKELVTSLEEASANRDLDWTTTLLNDAEKIPARWLIFWIASSA